MYMCRISTSIIFASIVFSLCYHGCCGCYGNSHPTVTGVAVQTGVNERSQLVSDYGPIFLLRGVRFGGEMY